MWIKICGIRDVATARAVAAFRPDAIGLNFFARSPRSVSIETAAEIVRELPAGIEPIGLFVDHDLTTIRSICDAVGLYSIQLHGDEPPELIAQLAPRRVLRAFRIGNAGLGEMSAYLAECGKLQALPRACLLDARVDGSYGGTGHTAPWDLIVREYVSDWPPLILAGGLQPDNLLAAIAAVKPWGVDVASGVESAPGMKCVSLVQRFIELARTARLHAERP